MSRNKVKDIRWRLSRESGTIIKDWGGKIPIALIYPNTYYIGMSNLGTHALYSLLNNYPGVVCERVFWEGKDQPLAPLSIESQRPLSDFAVLAFSINYELDYFHIVEILKASRIPLYAGERDENYPLVIAGGPCIIANPAPLSPFFDALCIGEAEPILPALLPVILQSIKSKRQELLKVLASLPGIYSPQYFQGTPVARQWAKTLDDFPVNSVILTKDTEMGALYLIEVERGCQRGCRFCLTSQAFRPIRFRSIDKLLTQAALGLQHRKRLGLVGPAVYDHPQLEELLPKLHEMGAELSISSLRIKPLPAKVIAELARGGAQSITLAPDAGSQRLRHLIKKDFSEDDILASIDKVARYNIKQLKLYFMIGLPSESNDDIEEMIKLTLKGKTLLDNKQPGCRLILSIAPFIPKAGTPFQWLAMEKLSTLNHRLSLLKDNLPPRGVEVKCESLAWSEIQAILARGDTKLAAILANIEEVSLSGWRRAIEKCPIEADYYSHRRWETSQKLPWMVVDSGAESGFLELELKRALG